MQAKQIILAAGLLFGLAFSASADTGHQLLLRTNLEVNTQYKYIPDIVNWGVSDYWASPAEFEEKGGGDCEDFAIAKYFRLIKAGFKVDDLRLAYSNSQPIGPHIILLAKLDNKWLALDNNYDDIDSPENRPYGIVLTFNEKQINLGENIFSVGALRRWTDVLARTPSANPPAAGKIKR